MLTGKRGKQKQATMGNAVSYFDHINHSIITSVEAIDNNTNSINHSNNTNTSIANCGLYLAESSIPNAGFGLYAGRNYVKGENFTKSYAIPLLEYSYMNSNKPTSRDIVWNIIEDYYWESYYHASNAFLEAESVKILVNDFGAMANHHALHENVGHQNIVFNEPEDKELDRFHSPSAGAYTYYSREFFTSKDVVAGEELFVNYGDDWGEDREEYEILTRNEYHNAIYVLERMIQVMEEEYKSIEFIELDVAKTILKNIFRNDKGNITTKNGLVIKPDVNFLNQCMDYAGGILKRRKSTKFKQSLTLGTFLEDRLVVYLHIALFSLTLLFKIQMN